jgi:hypothetical protein
MQANLPLPRRHLLVVALIGASCLRETLLGSIRMTALREEHT